MENRLGRNLSSLLIMGSCFPECTDGLWTLQYEEERNILISGSRDTTIKVWNMNTYTCEHTLTGHTGTSFLQSDHHARWRTGTCVEAFFLPRPSPP